MTTETNFKYFDTLEISMTTTLMLIVGLILFKPIIACLFHPTNNSMPQLEGSDSFNSGVDVNLKDENAPDFRGTL